MRVLAPSPHKAPPHLWSAAAERDERVGTMSLRGSPSHGAVLAAAHDVQSPRRGRTSKAQGQQAGLPPALKNTGRLDCCNDDDDGVGNEDDEEEELIPSRGGGVAAYPWGAWVHPRAPARCSKKRQAAGPLCHPAPLAGPSAGRAGSPRGGGDLPPETMRAARGRGRLRWVPASLGLGGEKCKACTKKSSNRVIFLR